MSAIFDPSEDMDPVDSEQPMIETEASRQGSVKYVNRFMGTLYSLIAGICNTSHFIATLAMNTVFDALNRTQLTCDREIFRNSKANEHAVSISSRGSSDPI